MPRLTPSAYLQGLQCPKLLWHRFHEPAAVAGKGPVADAVRAEGREVRQLACGLFPGGVAIPSEGGAAAQAAALSDRRPVFGAAFANAQAAVRCDVLAPAGAERWDVFAVRAATSAKPAAIQELALQAHVLRAAGLRPRRCLVLHINPDFVRRGPIDPAAFFRREEVTDAVDDLSGDLDEHLSWMRATAALPESPEPGIGPHCERNGGCPLQPRCWAFLPEHHVFTLRHIGRKGYKLFEQGFRGIRQLPPGCQLNAQQELQRQAVVCGQPLVQRPQLRRFLERLQYPLYYLDFETCSPAVPRFDGTTPFDLVPFQFSAHLQAAPGAALESVMYLAEGDTDPRPEFLARLRAALGGAGTVIAYNAAFEQAVLARCVAAFPEYAAWAAAVKARMADLLWPFKTFKVYHPAQRGSASMKAVLPAFTGRGYADLDLRDGGTASHAFARTHFAPAPAAERAEVRRQLAAYCGRDTEGMAWLVDALRALAGP